VSLGDSDAHFSYCNSVQCILECGHCAEQWDDWKKFVEHVNVRGVCRTQPCSAQYSWLRTGQETGSQPSTSLVVGTHNEQISPQVETTQVPQGLYCV